MNILSNRALSYLVVLSRLQSIIFLLFASYFNFIVFAPNQKKNIQKYFIIKNKIPLLVIADYLLLENSNGNTI